MTDMIQMCSLTMVGLMALGVQNKSDNFRAEPHRDGDDDPIESGVARGEAHAAVE